MVERRGVGRTIMASIDMRRITAEGTQNAQDGTYVLYWMQSAVRADHNHALNHAIGMANDLGCPVLVCACIMPDYPEASERHHAFYREGLHEATAALKSRGIPVVIGIGTPPHCLSRLLDDARALVTDDKPLRHQRAWMEEIRSMADCPVHIVETNVIVPVGVALEKEAYSAASLRPHVLSLVPEFVHPVTRLEVSNPAPELSLSFDSQEIPVQGEGTYPGSKGGHRHALAAMRLFVTHAIDGYADCRSAPGGGCTSLLSPYLHFGHISPCEVFHAAVSKSGPGVDAFVEQLVVRRELSYNFVHYNGQYDSIGCLPQWARDTLGIHEHDARDYTYSRKELESCSTHDPYWNAAQRQMMETGHMDGYMRMYWGKKVLEWSSRPEEAYRSLLELNNKYELDGRDPNGYAGVAWCFGKHDRPWKERQVFGKVRYMNDKGLERKFDMGPYLEQFGS